MILVVDATSDNSLDINLNRSRTLRRNSPAQSSVSPHSARLKRSLQLLADSVKELELVYGKYRSKHVNLGPWNDDLVDAIITQGMRPSTVAQKGIAISKVIETTVAEREDSTNSTSASLTNSIGGFVARLFPLIRILLDVGGSAAGVRDLFQYNALGLIVV